MYGIICSTVIRLILHVDGRKASNQAAGVVVAIAAPVRLSCSTVDNMNQVAFVKHEVTRRGRRAVKCSPH